MKKVFLFNSSNRYCEAWFDWYEGWTPLEDCLYKIVDVDKDIYRWVGDFDTGHLESVEQPVQILESFLDRKCEMSVLKAYPLERQMEILCDMLEKSSIQKTEAFKRMMDYINETRRINACYKKAYAKSDRFNYKTKKEEIEEQHKYNRRGGYERAGLHDIDRPFDIESLIQ